MRWAGYRKHGHTMWQGPPTRCRRARGSELVAREAESEISQKAFKMKKPEAQRGERYHDPFEDDP